MSFLGKTSLQRLDTCHPDLQRLIKAVGERVNFVVLCGHRTKEEQDEAVATKKSKTPWPNSKHNPMPSLAVDVWPWFPEVGLDWKDIPAGARLMGYIQAVADSMGIKVRFGIDWDGDWRSAGFDPSEKFYDGPHVELVL
jgi:peptidoglycan L-alanyl-D-glutamate endopeptidase CwlK